MKMKFSLTFILSFLLQQFLFATHNKAGDITFRHIVGLTYEITITIFADAESPAISRKEIWLSRGDNTPLDTIQVLSETRSSNNLKRIWKTTHTYPGPGSYRLRIEDPNRNGGVDNIVNSVNVPFVLETVLRISPFLNQSNNSPLLRNDPIDNACAGVTFVYNPGAFDLDGDSLAYELAPSLGVDGQLAPGYTFPPASNSLTVNPLNGDLIWDVPNQLGLYNVAILIKEYRNNVLISSVLRDLQIGVTPGCDNQPPIISSQNLACVIAGKTLSIPIIGSDQNASDRVTITATGEVLEPPINNRTNFNTGPVGNPTNASFLWNTNCTDVRKDLYNLSIRAEDNGIIRGSINLVNFKTIGIRVIAPSPENFTLSPIGNSIELSWTNGNCQNAIGYYLYRRLDSSGYISDSCDSGVPQGIGYEKITTIINTNTTNFLDDNNGLGLIPGQTYCYLITSFFEDGDESIASVEICGKVPKIVPVITNISVNKTDENTGEINLSWSPPDSFDSINFPPPYRYLISSFPAQNGNENLTFPTVNQEFFVDSTPSLNDTIFLVTNLNTLRERHFYRIKLISLGNGRQFVGQSAIASSIFLNINQTDELLQLKWQASTPWKNTIYTIYRKNPTSLTFDLITTTSNLNYDDTTVVNGLEYCYFIESEGEYQLNSVANPLINLSQINCAIPIDNIPPCPPILEAESNCELEKLILKWVNQLDECSEDVASYSIYRSKKRNSEMELIGITNSPTETIYDDFTKGETAGCYVVTATDSAGNESIFSNKICIDFCPIYDLPNVFTPNGDGFNDLFIPIQPYRDIDSIDLVIFNRWGEEVFKTKNPAIEWNGVNKNSDEPVNDGVYFYVCFVYEKNLDLTPEPRIIKSTLTIIDSKQHIKN